MSVATVTSIAIGALALAIAATGATITAHTQSSNKTTEQVQSAAIAGLQKENAGLSQALSADVAGFRQNLGAQAAQLHSVQGTANAAAGADLGYCVQYSNVTYVGGYASDGSTLDQQSLYYPSNISTPSVNSQGVVSCPFGSFVSVVPSKAGD
jgi:hypothetical protein